ncbi:cysteinyl-tRNA synthetase [Tulasnella sp. JGI-2019a]|nr:cysteinyl-tRNA synthetase [Tulasnella sp. JGI-2019a]KAG9012735.1 cysteinyl-tRNA synthetase [Tulasnella sp. JGI-2019a]
MAAMQAIRLLETQSPRPQLSVSSHSSTSPATTTNTGKYEPWNDIQLSTDGGVSSTGPLTPLPLAGSGPGNPTAIAPWLDDGSQDSPTGGSQSSRRFPFYSPKTSFSKQGSTLSPFTNSASGFNARPRVGSEASSQMLASNGVVGTPLTLGSEIGEAWLDRGSSSTVHLLEREGKDNKRSFMDRGKNIGRMIKKKASRVAMRGEDRSDDGHAYATMPLPYPSRSNVALDQLNGFLPPIIPPTFDANPLQTSPTQPIKEKKQRRFMVKGKSSKDKDRDQRGHSSRSSDPQYGEEELTLDTNLNQMEGIVDLTNVRSIAELKASANSGNGSANSEGIMRWDIDPLMGGPSSSEGGSHHLISSPNQVTTFTDPWASGLLPAGGSKGGQHKRPEPPISHSRSTSSGGSPLSRSVAPSKRRSQQASVDLCLSPRHTVFPNISPLSPPEMNPPVDESSDPAWKPPESWDVDKAGPNPGYYSSDEDMDGTTGKSGDRSMQTPSISEVEGQGFIDVGPQSSATGAGSPVVAPGKGRNGSLNVFHSQGLIAIPNGGQFGLAFGGHGRPRKQSDVYPPIPGSSHSMHGAPSYSSLRKESILETEGTIRRPSDALSAATTSRTLQISFHLRVYRMDGTYHIVECPTNTSASDLSHVLRKKLLLPGNQFKLHVRERGRERVLGVQERPVSILRRRLEQAGYDDSDNLEQLGGEDLTFLLRFVFRDANLTAAQASGEDDVFSTSTSLEHIDLTGRGLLTIPIALHRHASTIVVLNLSKNPHIDIPLDFIGSCTMLRDLRLSHAAMKQVPSRVKHITTLHELDISCNRMVTLDEADLHKIMGLKNIQAQNNRLATLPTTFSQMKSLKFLNISNNQFENIPAVLCKLKGLVDLDLSFNTVSEFPPELGHLIHLERLVIVGNRIDALPSEISNMIHLQEFDCRRNLLTDLSPVLRCVSLEVLRAENNLLHNVELVPGSKIKRLCISGNERLTSFIVQPPEGDAGPYPLEILDLSKCMLSALDDSSMSHLRKLITLNFDHNTIRAIPHAVCHLPELKLLSGSNNRLSILPSDIGHLIKLETLLIHNNNVKVVPATIWKCQSLVTFNASSNLIDTWDDHVEEGAVVETERKLSTVSALGKSYPPLASCLERLYLADNRLSDDILFHTLTPMRCLKVLNLSFNDIYELPPFRMNMFTSLRELYLSGNKLTSLPGEDLYRLQNLRILFLNVNKLQTLPTELTKVKTLECLDVGSNVLKYNVANWQFDWNWNFNRELRYLNLSGNKRLEIKNTANHDLTKSGRAPLTDFSELSQLRLLGLMDVTLSVDPAIPDENEDRRVRTSPSDINGMAYGIADSLGWMDMIDKSSSLKLSMFDLVIPSFRGRENEAIFGMFGRHVPLQNGNRSISNRLTRYLQRHFVDTFHSALDALKPEFGEAVPDALRRAFLALNKDFYETLKPPEGNTPRKMSSHHVAPGAATVEMRSAASGLVLYVVDEPDNRMMYVANTGSIGAVVARKHANPAQLSADHDPFDRNETVRIRAAEGWVSPKGTVNDELDISRSFGVYHLLPAVNARPDVAAVPITDQDEFVIIGNRGLWDFVSPKTAVDIARLNITDPMIAAQRLRDYAMSYGAQGSTMIMVVSIGDLFKPKMRLQSMDLLDDDFQRMAPRRKDAQVKVGEKELERFGKEIDPPVGHVALVFTDIINSTSLWEKNPGMPSAMKLHNMMLRRHLRAIGGYEVKTEGDAFMVSFSTIPAALLWAFQVQVQLLKEPWPLWITESEDGKVVRDADGAIIARGLSLRMGIHWGAPNCEEDPVTGRMDYFGTMVNRAARITSSAGGGQINISNDVVREITNLIPMEEQKGVLVSVDNAHIPGEAANTIEAIKRMGVVIKTLGESRLKGLEVPEMLSSIYPKELAGRIKYIGEPVVPEPAAASRVQFSVEQVSALATLTIRIEALTSGRVFRPISALYRNDSVASTGEGDEIDQSIFMYANPDMLLPAIKETATDADLLLLIDSLSVRIQNALATLYLKQVGGYHGALAALEQAIKVDPGVLLQALGMFSDLLSA